MISALGIDPGPITGYLEVETDGRGGGYNDLAGRKGSGLCGDASMRARYRESLRSAKPVEAGKVEKYVFDNFTFFSRKIAAGSRLRLVVRSITLQGAEKNYNSGGVVAAETGKDAKTAHLSLIHDAEHPCALELPIVKP